MKSKLKLLTLIACGTSFALVQSSMAQAPAADSSPAPSAAGDKHPGKGPHGGERGGNRLEMLTKLLDLTADQQAAIKPILETEREANKKAHDTAEEGIKGILTADQKAKLEKMKADHPHGGPGGPGGPEHDAPKS